MNQITLHALYMNQTIQLGPDNITYPGQITDYTVYTWTR